MNRLTVGLAVLAAALLAIGLAYLGFIGIDAAPVSAFRNVSDAMRPTLLAGDRFTVRQNRPESSELPWRGELVAHVWPPDRSKQFIKRIVGLPGDTLEMIEGRLQVNHRPVNEPYAWHADSTVDPVVDDFQWQRKYLVEPAARDTARYTASRNNWGPLLVPARMYFVLGDNRDNSLDSRYWGFLPRTDILGEVRRVYFSEDSAGRIRWSRLGHRVR